jgi:hypothetical protein
MNCSLHGARQFVSAALILTLTCLPLLGNFDPKKGRVTDNPTSGNKYTLDQEVDYGWQAIPEIEKDLPLLPPDHPAKSVEMLGASTIYEGNQPIPERIRLVALHGKGGVVLYLVFVAPDADFDALRPRFDRILRGFSVR